MHLLYPWIKHPPKLESCISTGCLLHDLWASSKPGSSLDLFAHLCPSSFCTQLAHLGTDFDSFSLFPHHISCKISLLLYPISCFFKSATSMRNPQAQYQLTLAIASAAHPTQCFHLPRVSIPCHHPPHPPALFLLGTFLPPIHVLITMQDRNNHLRLPTVVT